MCEAEQTRVQSLTGKGGDPVPNFPAARDAASGACAVKRIADQRMTTMSEVYPDLMRSPRREAALDERRARPEGALDTVSRDRRFSFALPDDGHLLAIGIAATDVLDDLAGRGRRQPPNDRDIGAVDPA